MCNVGETKSYLAKLQTWTGVEKTNSKRFSKDKPGTTQHMSSCAMYPKSIPNMKYIINSIQGSPNVRLIINAVRHLLMSSLGKN